MSNAHANYKKDYCNKQVYYTNTGADDGSTYPHFHCDKDFMTYSASSSQHYNFAVGSIINKGTAGSACYKALEQRANNLRTIIGEVCDDYDKVCDGCP